MGEWPTAVINPPVRILMGPGPSPVHPRVYRAMAAPMLGYQDPAFHQIMDEVKTLLRMLFDTGNELSFPVSGTGSAGMETAVCNSLEPGDHIVVGINGFFGGRIAEMARRVGAEVTLVEAEWGSIVEPQALKAALDQHPNTKVVALVHGETSTGVLQPMEEIARLVKEHDALLILDTVTSLGGCPVDVDAWQVDFCYSGTQKCLNVPPGLAPLTVSPRGVAAIKARTHPVVNWYLDLSLIQNYWGQGRAYHHTPPVSMIYALREGLALIAEEGLKPRFQRHIRNARALYAGLEAMGLQLFVPQEHRLPSLTTVRVPEGVDDARVRGALLAEHSIDIAGGQGPLAGVVWRIGLMGYGSSPEHLLSLLAALGGLLAREGFKGDVRAGVAAAAEALAQAGPD